MRCRWFVRLLATALFGAVLATVVLVPAPRALAQTPPDLNAADAMRQAIEPHVGRRVRLKLVSGQDIEGQVARVGATAVAMTELTGMELFDATVRIDQVAALIVRRAK